MPDFIMSLFLMNFKVLYFPFIPLSIIYKCSVLDDWVVISVFLETQVIDEKGSHQSLGYGTNILDSNIGFIT